MTGRMLVLELTAIEAAHLTDLVEQFADLVTEPAVGADDPAVLRLVPDAYSDDASAASEFRRLTEADLLHRRAADAGHVIASLLRDGERLAPASLDPSRLTEEFRVVLDEEQTGSWLRTLSALRLVLASRLGIEDEDDHDDADPRFGVYDWLGYRLDGLVRAIDESGA